MEITKVKITKENTVTVTYRDADENTVTVDGKNIVHSDLRTAFKELTGHMAILCELREAKENSLPDDLKELSTVEVTGYSIGGTDEEEGVTLIGKRFLQSKKVLNLIAPFTKFNNDNEEYPYAFTLMQAIENKPEIDHINTIRDDNRVENLRWVTRKENRNNPISLEHLRIAFTGENSPHYGRKRSKETRKRISEALKLSPLNHGRTGSMCKNSKPVYQYDLQGNFIAEYAGQAEAARMTGIHQSDISNACNGKSSIAGGYLWRKTHTNKIEINTNYKKSLKNRAVLQYDKNNNLIKEWSSVAEISKELGFRAATIRACCNGQIAVSHGFIWRYK